LHRQFPTLYPGATFDDAMQCFFANGTPSMSRAFVRGQASQLLPHAQLTASAAKAAAQALPPVFPALAHAGGAASGVPLHSRATALSALQYGVTSDAIGAELMTTLETMSWEALAVCARLLQLPLKLLHSTVPHVPVEMAREEVMRTLLMSAVSGAATVEFARRAVLCVLAWATLDKVMLVVGNAEFLTKPNFAAVVAVFAVFSARVVKDGPPEIAEWCRILHSGDARVFGDEFRTRIFRDLSDPANIADALHGHAR
jgi:hypothetical protein